MLKTTTTLSVLALVLVAPVYAGDHGATNDPARAESSAKRMISDDVEGKLQRGDAKAPAEVTEARTFTRLDANGDGALQEQEVADTDIEGKPFESADANDDGKLDRDEYDDLQTLLGHQAGSAGGA
ncbi:MAG: hypothetical protein RLW61_18300 [Gammaproteobacteria bacterium]